MAFRIGEKIVYINKIPFKNDHFLKHNKIYTVVRTTTCRCGDQLIDIAESPYSNKCYCVLCNYTFYKQWFRANMFRKLITGEILDELLESNPIIEEKPDISIKEPEKCQQVKQKQ
jgi:hypothetical protein